MRPVDPHRRRGRALQRRAGAAVDFPGAHLQHIGRHARQPMPRLPVRFGRDQGAGGAGGGDGLDARSLQRALGQGAGLVEAEADGGGHAWFRPLNSNLPPPRRGRDKGWG